MRMRAVNRHTQAKPYLDFFMKTGACAALQRQPCAFLAHILKNHLTGFV